MEILMVHNGFYVFLLVLGLFFAFGFPQINQTVDGTWVSLVQAAGFWYAALGTYFLIANLRANRFKIAQIVNRTKTLQFKNLKVVVVQSENVLWGAFETFSSGLRAEGFTVIKKNSLEEALVSYGDVLIVWVTDNVFYEEHRKQGRLPFTTIWLLTSVAAYMLPAGVKVLSGNVKFAKLLEVINRMLHK